MSDPYHQEPADFASDPFAKAKAIRNGELDDEMPSYDELTGWVQRLPQTWLPGLLRRIVYACVDARVFQEGGLARYVARSEEIAKLPNKELREG